MYFWIGIIIAVASLSLTILSLKPIWLLLLLISAWCAYQENKLKAIREQERLDRLKYEKERKQVLDQHINRYNSPDWVDFFERSRSDNRANTRSTLVTSIPPNTTTDPNLNIMIYDTFGSTSVDNDKCRTAQVESGWSSDSNTSSNNDCGSSSSYDSSPSTFD